jgi:hypothetical protein
MSRLDPEARMAIGALSARGATRSEIARLLGVTEGAVRYHVRRMASGAADGRSRQRRAAEAFAGAIGHWRSLREGAGGVNLAALHEWLRREHAYGGSLRSVQRYWRRAYPAPAIRARRRVETPPGAQAQVDWAHFPGVAVGGEAVDLLAMHMVLSWSRAEAVVWSRGGVVAQSWRACMLAGMSKAAEPAGWCKTRYRTRNWPEYDRGLIARGDLAVWPSPGLVWHAAEGTGRRGRPPVFGDTAIQRVLTLKVLFQLPLRAAQGLVRSLLRLARLDGPVPHYSTLSRRQKALTVAIPYRPPGEPLHLVVDSTGLEVPGEGEWKVRRHGADRRRVWREVHLPVDADGHEIRAAEMTDQRHGDGEIVLARTRSDRRRWLCEPMCVSAVVSGA